MKEVIRRIQQELRAAGTYPGQLDGIWGPQSEKALRDVLEPPAQVTGNMAWGKKVSPLFKQKVADICSELGIPSPDLLMACMAFETGETFSPSVSNAAGSGATGLIQFMPSTARGLNTTTTELAAMSAEEQLDYVKAYFRPYRGRLKTLEDLYMAILWPAAVGKIGEYVLFNRGAGGKAYIQNRGLDVNVDGKITKTEAAGKVLSSLRKGRLLENFG